FLVGRFIIQRGSNKVGGGDEFNLRFPKENFRLKPKIVMELEESSIEEIVTQFRNKEINIVVFSNRPFNPPNPNGLTHFFPFELGHNRHILLLYDPIRSIISFSVIYKIITKMLAIRLKENMDHLISLS
ncbi:hypothetical protein CR513_41328, partial [Mucuna pruriens]